MPDGKRRYSNILKAVYDRPWAILPSMLAVIEEIVQLRASGFPLTPDDIQARVSAARNGPRQGAQGGSVSVIPIYGVLTKRAGLMSEMSGATSLEEISAGFRSALADPDVGAIVFDVDSPGGEVAGITELAGEIRGARGRKPMVAVANATMASAAYWLGSQADQVIATPSSVVGSIGVIGAHTDVTAQDEMLGEKVTLITAGEGKAFGNEHLALSDEARAEMQGMADDFYGLFVSDVAAARGVKAAKVTDTWKAAIFTAEKAKAAGLIDGIGTLESTIARQLGRANRPRMGAYAVTDGTLDALDAEQFDLGALLATLPIHEQLALLTAESERITAHYAKRAELRAKEGRTLPDPIQEQLAALNTLGTIRSDDDTDLGTDQPEEAEATPAAAGPRRIGLALYEAAVRGGYQLSHNEVSE